MYVQYQPQQSEDFEKHGIPKQSVPSPPYIEWNEVMLGFASVYLLLIFAYMIEGLGIALFEDIQGCDESAIVGLPLLAVCSLLRTVGMEPLAV